MGLESFQIWRAAREHKRAGVELAIGRDIYLSSVGLALPVPDDENPALVEAKTWVLERTVVDERRADFEVLDQRTPLMARFRYAAVVVAVALEAGAIHGLIADVDVTQVQRYWLAAGGAACIAGISRLLAQRPIWQLYVAAAALACAGLVLRIEQLGESEDLTRAGGLALSVLLLAGSVGPFLFNHAVFAHWAAWQSLANARRTALSRLRHAEHSLKTADKTVLRHHTDPRHTCAERERIGALYTSAWLTTRL